MIRIQQHDTGETGSHHAFDLTDRGLLLADGVFDTSMVRVGKIVLMERHLDRLARDCDALGIDVSRDALESFALEAIPAGANGALRLTVTRGPGPRGLAPKAHGEPTLISKFDASEPAFPLAPARLSVSGIHRNPSAPSSRHKTLAYTDTLIGMQRARARGFDDALYLTPDGHVACSSVANVFARFGDDLITPPLEDGVLKGVMRGWLLEHAGDAGLRAREATLRPEHVETADAIYLTNSLQLIRGVSALDNLVLDPEIPSGLKDLCETLVQTSPSA